MTPVVPFKSTFFLLHLEAQRQVRVMLKVTRPVLGVSS